MDFLPYRIIPLRRPGLPAGSILILPLKPPFRKQRCSIFTPFYDPRLLYTGSSFSLWKVTKIIFLFHQNYFSRKKFCGYRFRLHVLLLKLSTVSINSLLRRVEFIDFCGWFLHASFLSDHFLELFTWKIDECSSPANSHKFRSSAIIIPWKEGWAWMTCL